jgi:G3E family GTPase
VASAVPSQHRPAIPITVIGGYLGAGKTTLLNRLLQDPGGRRLGVIVNDFGAIGIDAELLAAASDTGVVNLPNGCVCCTLGGDLFETLARLRDGDEPPDQIVIEASGVADPAAAAAWGTSAGFEPGGVIVLAAADSIRRQLVDKYVGGEVHRQLAGADLIVLTKTDLCTDQIVVRSIETIEGVATGVPVIRAPTPADVVLGVGVRASLVEPVRDNHLQVSEHRHADGADDSRYERWSWTAGPVSEPAHDVFADHLRGVLRLKAVLDIGVEHVEVQVVGGRTTFGRRHGLARGSRAEAVLQQGSVDASAISQLFAELVGPKSAHRSAGAN